MFNQISDAETINRIAHFHLCAYLVTFSNSYITHVISKSGNLHIKSVIISRGCSHPYGYPFNSILILIMTYNHFPVQSHPGTDKTELTITVSRLVKIHEIHIDRFPWNVPVKLGM